MIEQTFAWPSLDAHLSASPYSMAVSSNCQHAHFENLAALDKPHGPPSMLWVPLARIFPGTEVREIKKELASRGIIINPKESYKPRKSESDDRPVHFLVDLVALIGLWFPN